MIILTKAATAALNQALRLPATGLEQDWDIELADADRIHEFITFMAQQPLDDDTRLALMALILASLDDFSNRQTVPMELATAVRQVLQAAGGLYDGLVRQWSSLDGDEFSISPLMRSL